MPCSMPIASNRPTPNRTGAAPTTAAEPSPPPIGVRLLLLVSGLVAVGVGASLAIDPAGFQAAQGIEVGSGPSVFSELRAPGGALVAIGLVVLAGALRSSLAFASLTMSAAVYLGYGLTRVLSLAVDGRPSDELVVALGFELVLGGLCALALVGRARSRSPRR